MQIPNSDKLISFYILDVIISVGYRAKSNIRKHIINIFKENNNGQNLPVNGVKQKVPFYNLDVIISVGYRIKYISHFKVNIFKERELI